MRRRTMLGLGGAAAVAAAGAGLAWECRVPDSAVAAWRAAPAEREAMRFALAHAILAPNPHNMQPWRVSLPEPSFAELRLDPARLLPATDPHGRQILMGTGAFLELFGMAAAARGLRAAVDMFPEGEPGDGALDGRPVARMGLRADGGGTKDPLFEQVLVRRTDRRAYDPVRRPDADDVGRLRAAVEAGPMAPRVEVVTDARQVEALRAIAREAWRIELTTAAAMMELMRVLRAGASEIGRYRDGIALTEAMPVALAKLGLLDRDVAPPADSYAVTAQLAWFDALTASTPAYLVITTPTNRRLAQVEAGRAYMRVALAAAGMGLALHPNEQALQEYPEMAGPYRAVHAALARPGETVQMLARIGRLPAGTAPLGPAPRRGLAALLEPLESLA